MFSSIVSFFQLPGRSGHLNNIADLGHARLYTEECVKASREGYHDPFTNIIPIAEQPMDLGFYWPSPPDDMVLDASTGETAATTSSSPTQIATLSSVPSSSTHSISANSLENDDRRDGMYERECELRGWMGGTRYQPPLEQASPWAGPIDAYELGYDLDSSPWPREGTPGPSLALPQLSLSSEPMSLDARLGLALLVPLDACAPDTGEVLPEAVLSRARPPSASRVSTPASTVLEDPTPAPVVSVGEPAANTPSFSLSLAPRDSWITVHLHQFGSPMPVGLFVHGVLGAGGFGEVWSAMFAGPAGPTPIALKEIALDRSNGAGWNTYVAEIQTAMHIARVPDLQGRTPLALWHGISGIHGFIAYDLVSGGDVYTHMENARQDRLPLPDVLAVGLQVAATLAVVHRVGGIHRDIKPENVLVRGVGQDGRLKVLLADWGLAQWSAPFESMAGTPGYVPLEDERSISSDMYALAVTLAELAMGERLFPGPAAKRRLDQLDPAPLLVGPAFMSPAGKELRRLVLRLLTDAPEDRFTPADSAEELRVLLEMGKLDRLWFVESQPTPPSPVPSPTGTPSPPTTSIEIALTPPPPTPAPTTANPECSPKKRFGKLRKAFGRLGKKGKNEGKNEGKSEGKNEGSHIDETAAKDDKAQRDVPRPKGVRHRLRGFFKRQ